MNWIHDESLNNIEPEKLNYMEKCISQLKEKPEKERLPYLLALANRFKKENISFSEKEASLMISAIKNHSSDEEITKMNQMLKAFSERQK